MAQQFDKGDRVRMAVKFTQSSVETDPTEVTFRYLPPASTLVLTEVYNGGAGNVVRDSSGNYHFDLTFDSTDVWTYRWEGTGAVVAATPDYQILVRRSVLT